MSNSPTDMGLTTNQLIEKIFSDFGYTFDRTTISWWTRREEDPLPVVYRGKAGQSHRYSWDAFEAWFARHREREAERSAEGVDAMDYNEARTIEQREKAKQSQIATLEKSQELGDRKGMENEVADLVLTAREKLLTVPDRMAALVAAETDESKCYQMLRAEMILVCGEMAKFGEGSN